MNPNFERWMSQATRLTRSGKLKDAVAAIQAAIQTAIQTTARRSTQAPQRPTGVEDRGIVVDVPAREVAEAQPETLTQTPTETTARTPVRTPVHTPVHTPSHAPAKKPAGTPETTPEPLIAGSHSDKAGSRDYKLYIPPCQPLPGGPGLPLVVMLHGCTQNPDDFAAGTRMNQAAGQQGCYVLYPAQPASANPQRCWTWFKHNHQQRDRGEPAILAGMVRHVIGQHAIDPRRVYVAGLSAGGAMAAILGQAYPDLFAAVGVHSGLATGAASDVASALLAMQGAGADTDTDTARPAARPPTIVFHGDQDSTVHPVNGERAAATGPGAAPPEVRLVARPGGHASTQTLSRDASGHVTTEHWLVHGAGHAWAGGSGQGSYTDPKGPDATREMLRFFAQWQLAAVH